MKRLSLLSACILLIGATMVQAETINVTMSRSSYGSGLDLVLLNITSMTGTVPTGNVITGLLGTWTATNGTFNLAGTNSTWATKLLNNFDDGGSIAAPTSWVNFSSKTTDPISKTGTLPAISQFTAGYYGTSAGADGVPGYALGAVDLTPGSTTTSDGQGGDFDNTLLAKFYVSSSTTLDPGTVLFSGTGNYCQANGGIPVVGVATTVQIIPEPTSLALLGCGLFGLLAYAWRKRK